MPIAGGLAVGKALALARDGESQESEAGASAVSEIRIWLEERELESLEL
jgi:hypothetical protein